MTPEIEKAVAAQVEFRAAYNVVQGTRFPTAAKRRLAEGVTPERLLELLERGLVEAPLMTPKTARHLLGEARDQFQQLAVEAWPTGPGAPLATMRNRAETMAAKIDQFFDDEFKCGTCDGERVIDSGGQNPDGSWVNLPCPDCPTTSPWKPVQLIPEAYKHPARRILGITASGSQGVIGFHEDRRRWEDGHGWFVPVGWMELPTPWNVPVAVPAYDLPAPTTTPPKGKEKAIVFPQPLRFKTGWLYGTYEREDGFGGFVWAGNEDGLQGRAYVLMGLEKDRCSVEVNAMLAELHARPQRPDWSAATIKDAPEGEYWMGIVKGDLFFWASCQPLARAIGMLNAGSVDVARGPIQPPNITPKDGG